MNVYFDNFINGSFVNAKLLTWEDEIKTNFHGKEIPLYTNIYATCVLKIGNIYKQADKYYPQVYIKECKFTTPDKTQISYLDNISFDSI